MSDQETGCYCGEYDHACEMHGQPARSRMDVLIDLFWRMAVAPHGTVLRDDERPDIQRGIEAVLAQLEVDRLLLERQLWEGNTPYAFQARCEAGEKVESLLKKRYPVEDGGVYWQTCGTIVAICWKAFGCRHIPEMTP